MRSVMCISYCLHDWQTIFIILISTFWTVDREQKWYILDRQKIASQCGLQLIFRMHNTDPTPQGVENRNILLLLKCVLTALHVNYDSVWQSPLTITGKKCTLEWNSVLIKDRERDVQVWKNVKVYFKWGWNKSPFDINSVVFHFDDFNNGRRSQPFFFLQLQLSWVFS